jgi:hypothetical protein
MTAKVETHTKENAGVPGIHLKNGVRAKPGSAVTGNSIEFSRDYPVPEDLLRNLRYAVGMETLLQCGVSKVIAGETDLMEVLSVCIR